MSPIRADREHLDENTCQPQSFSMQTEEKMEETTQPTSTTNAADPTRPQGNTPRSNSENSNFRTSGSNSSGSSGYGGKLSSMPSTAQKDNSRALEENTTSTSITNAVDSAYSQSNGPSLCSFSSQCRMRGSNSSGSSGYGGKQTTSLSAAQAENSASSGNSAELTTIKNLKRTKNKGRKKKAKTKQCQTQSNVKIEPEQECKPQDNKSNSDITTTQITEQITELSSNTPQPDEVAVAVDENGATDIQTAAERDTSQKEPTNENKTVHDPNVVPLTTTESVKEKLDGEKSAFKSPDDLEVDNILSHSKVEQNADRPNLMQESFCCAISMHDGVILSTTANLTESLGFPKDVWLGRAFIDFVHPKDRPTFASQITSGYMDHISTKNDYYRPSHFEKTPLYVLLRCYRGFDAFGFAVKNKPVSYKPFKLIFQKPPEMPSNSMPNGNSALRIICAIAMSSIYKVPDEAMKNKNAKFSTRHTAAGMLVHIDGTSVAAIGYMPQDILGKSIMDLFHPEDMILLKTAYEVLMKDTHMADSRVSSPPYRFLINNGCYITLETEWTKVFNPWSRKLEFVTGDHCVLRGPNHCNIFSKTGKFTWKFPNDILEKAAKLKKELLKLQSEPVPYPSDSVKQQVSKRCQALAAFMETLLAGVKKEELKLDLVVECEPAASEHGSVMLGEISPHHHSNHDDSKSSSETPPTYNQLNYFENLNRFFNSVHPTFVPNEFKSLPYKIDHVPTNEKDRMLSPIQQCGEESGGSFNSSSDSPQFDSTNTSNESNNGNNQAHLLLTEASVSRHTDQMELQMVKNHKKYRTRASHVADKKKAPDKGYANVAMRSQPMKRSWPNEKFDNELAKNSKSHNLNEHRYTAKVGENAEIDETNAQNAPNKASDEVRPNTSQGQSKLHAVHLWPPFSVNATTVQNNIPTNSIPTSINQFLLTNHLTTPRYYMPPVKSNGILQMDQMLSNQPTQNANNPPNIVAGNLSNPYALQYIKNIMTRPFMGQNMNYPYLPIAYHPLPMLQKMPTETQASGAANVSLEMPTTSSQSVRNIPNMLIFENVTKPVNLSKIPDEKAPKVQPKSWNQIKEDNSEEVDASNSSFSSSFFDSQLRTDDSWESDKTSKDDAMELGEQTVEKKDVKKRGNTPYWMKNVVSTPELVLRYQLGTKELQDVLQADLRVLRELNQPGMVNEQLDQLYLEMDLENPGQPARISLGDTPSNSSEDEENMSKKKKNTHYSKLSMIYEENAPVQPPV